MKKQNIILLTIGSIILCVIIICAILQYLGFISLPFINPEGKICGGIAGRPCPEGYTCEYESDQYISDDTGVCTKIINNENTNTTDPDEPVEYDESYGTTCPLGIKFLGKAFAPSIDCTCPEGYEFDSEIIGYEQCYGEGTECPIMSSECVIKNSIDKQ